MFSIFKLILIYYCLVECAESRLVQTGKKKVHIKEHTSTQKVTKPSQWKNSILNKIQQKMKELNDDEDEASGHEIDGDKDDDSDDTDEFDNDEESGSGKEYNISIPESEMDDAQLKKNIPFNKSAPKPASASKPYSSPKPTSQGSWTLSCPAPCSQTCAPSCTPQCCMDNFAMAPPVPENSKEMYLCPNFCTTLTCPATCPSYCCALSPVIPMGNGGGPSQVFTNRNEIPSCPGYCSAYAQNNCPRSCNIDCCMTQNTMQPPVSVNAQYGYSSDMANIMNQVDLDLCAAYCSDPVSCATNAFCPPMCCKK